MARARRIIGCALVGASISLLPAPSLPAAATPASGDMSFAVTRFDDPVPDGCAPADCSLREAIIAANNTPGRDSITLKAGMYVLTISKTSPDAISGDLDISDDLVITGSGATSTTISGGGDTVGDRVIDVFNPATVSLSSLAIRHGVVGGVANTGTLSLTDVSVSGNTADVASGSGGGLTNGGILTLTNVTVSGNRSAGNGGGGLNETSSSLTLTNVTVSGNVADNRGG